MQYGINLGHFSRYTGMEKAAEYVAAAGFECVDYTPPITEDNWECVMKEDMKIFEANGLCVHQTHSPFNRYGRYGDKHKIYVERAMEATAFMGAKFIAVHGDEFDFENLTYSDEAALNYNHDYFEPYIEFGRKNGFKLAFETVFQERSMKEKRFTSNPDELLGLVLSFGGDAVCCWDFGHANVSFPKTAAEWIKKFGSLIQCTHVHDNTGMDSHQLPMTGKIDWNETIMALKEIGYGGVMSIEYAHGNIPPELLPEYLKLSFELTRHIWNM